MSRYIDLDKVAEHKNSYCNTTSITHCNHDCAECFYENGGAEDVAPIIHGKWESENLYDEWWGMSYKCGICGQSVIGKPNYCSNCGTKMDGELMMYSYEEKIELYKQMEAVEKLCGDDYWDRLEKWEE